MNTYIVALEGSIPDTDEGVIEKIGGVVRALIGPFPNVAAAEEFASRWLDGHAWGFSRRYQIVDWVLTPARYAAECVYETGLDWGVPQSPREPRDLRDSPQEVMETWRAYTKGIKIP